MTIFTFLSRLRFPWNILLGILLLAAILAAIALGILELAWTYRAFAGGWVPIFGVLEGGLLTGLLYFFFGGFIVLVLISTVLTLGMSALCAAIYGLASLCGGVKPEDGSEAKTNLFTGIVVFALIAGVCSYFVFRDSQPVVNIDIIKKAPMQLVAISPGSFLMGPDKGETGKPNHRVVITNMFYMGATEVTQAQYRAVMNASPSNFKGDDLPVESVSWSDAVEFCRRLTEAERNKGNLPEGWQYRLPTEAEWEYCCRAGSSSRYCFGDDPSTLVDYAWFEGNSASTTHPVRAKNPNAWGLYDMHGNVWEWCLDWCADEYPEGEQIDPVGPTSGQYRILRGGSWFPYVGACCSADRAGNFPGNRGSPFGFRVVVAQGRQN